MIQKKTIDFLKDLQKNNNKPWFDNNKETYNTARAAFVTSVEEIIAGFSSFEPDIANLAAKECVFRINRDVRFSKDKQPYKNNMSAYFNRAGKKGTGAGYYIHIEPGKSFAAAGVWMPEADILSKIRQEIDYNFAEWKKITGSAAFKKQFEKGIDTSNVLVRAPKGYEETNPAISFLKLKNFVASRPFSDAALMSKTFVTDLSKTFKTVKPMLDFINRSLD
ncbi:MAG: DUF2461 domain-containing protein [Gloeobacteraceae cyanobacterium ES-bin-316]|nr:DUF2461 domain-containing protein [Ferruginibacter sp.]